MPSLRLRPRSSLAVPVVALVAATVVVAALERGLGVADASIVYLTAVVAAAVATGTVGAIVTAIAAFLIYDFLFTQPYFTFAIRDAHEWLSVVLLLFVGVVVGQLTALQRSRAAVAEAREREARALFSVSRELATRDSTAAVLPRIAAALSRDAEMDRVWIALGPDDATERIVADTDPEETPTVPLVHSVLRRTPADEPARWIRVHQAAVRPPAPRGRRDRAGRDAFRVRIEAGGSTIGSIWGTRPVGRGEPERTATRLLAAAADQLGQAIAHDRLLDDARAAEVARQSDALKSALLQSVSHDLRTPLATIRAAAGSLRSGAGLTRREQDESAAAIDREVAYLDRLVTNLLDLSRIEAGGIRASREVFELDDVVAPAVARTRGRLGSRRLAVRLVDRPVVADAVFLDEILANLLENAAKYTPDGADVRISASAPPGAREVRLTVEDSGPGVPAEALAHLFDKFYRAASRDRSRSGLGIGLAVVRGLTEAMGGRVQARVSELGGLAIDVDLPAAEDAHARALSSTSLEKERVGVGVAGPGSDR